jgi:hypothetical protein
MPHPWHDVPIGDQAPEEFTALIEIPKGSRVKYEPNKDSGLLCASPFSVCLTISTIKGVVSPAGQDLRCSWAESSPGSSKERQRVRRPYASNSGPRDAAKILRNALSPPAPGMRKLGWA